MHCGFRLVPEVLKFQHIPIKLWQFNPVQFKIWSWRLSVCVFSFEDWSSTLQSFWRYSWATSIALSTTRKRSPHLRSSSIMSSAISGTISFLSWRHARNSFNSYLYFHFVTCTLTKLRNLPNQRVHMYLQGFGFASDRVNLLNFYFTRRQ